MGMKEIDSAIWGMIKSWCVVIIIGFLAYMFWGNFQCTPKTIPLRQNDFESTCLPVLIPCLEFTIEIQSNNLMYNPNKEIREKVFHVKIGKFSVKYYTF